MSKATLRQLLFVVCSVVSNVTPAPTPQELPHRDKDAGGGRIAMPPHLRATAAPAPYPAPQRGSSFCSPPHYSGHAKSRRSAAWPMINADGCGAKSSPSGGAIVSVLWRTCRRRAWDLAAQRVVGPPRGRRWAAESGAGAGVWVSRRGRRHHCAGWNTPASLLAGRRETRTRTCAGQRHGLANAGASRA
jgi:hypothetical protein